MTRPRTLAAVPLLLFAATAATGCVGTKNPEGWASPAVSDQTVLYFQKKDRLAAVQLDGTAAPVQWTFPNEDLHRDQKDISLKAVYETPVVDGDVVYLGDYEGDLIALNRADGTIRWRVDRSRTDGSIVGGPVEAGDLLVFGTTEGKLYAYNKADGTPALGWGGPVTVTEKGLWASPVAHEDTVIVAGMDGAVTAYRTTDGTVAWTSPYDAGGAVAELAMLPGGRLFVPSLNGQVAILSAADGSQQGGTFQAKDWVWTTPAFADDRAYFGDFSGHIYALDITSMTTAWEYDAGARIKAAPAIVDGTLVAADRDAVVHFLDLNDGGKLLSKVPLPDGSGTVRAGVVANNGRALIATTEGRLFSADPKTRAVNQVDVRAAG